MSLAVLTLVYHDISVIIIVHVVYSIILACQQSTILQCPSLMNNFIYCNYIRFMLFIFMLEQYSRESHLIVASEQPYI